MPRPRALRKRRPRRFMTFRGSGVPPLIPWERRPRRSWNPFSVQPAATRGARRSSGKELRRSIPGPTSRILTTSMRHVGSRHDWAHPARCGALAASSLSFPRGVAVEASFGSPPSRVLPLAPPHRPGSLNGCRHVGKKHPTRNRTRDRDRRRPRSRVPVRIFRNRPSPCWRPSSANPVLAAGDLDRRRVDVAATDYDWKGLSSMSRSESTRVP